MTHSKQLCHLNRRRPAGALSLIQGFFVLMALLMVYSGPAVARQNAEIVVDADTGAVLTSRNAEMKNRPASLTKMMTLYLTFEALRDKRLTLDKQLPVSRHAASQSPTKLYLQPGGRIRVEDAIYAAVTKSANDATVVLAETLGGTESAFAQMMTAKAHALGMYRTQFRNASGLPHEQQTTTARDMAILGQALYRNFPQYVHYFATPEFRWGKNRYRNHNRLLGSYEGVDGIKTGYTNASGFNLVTSVRRNGRHVFAVVLGGQTSAARDQQMRKLLDRTFAQIEPGFDPKTVRITAVAPARIASTRTVENVPAKKPAQNVQVRKLAAKSAKENGIRNASVAKSPRWGVQVGTFSVRSHAQERAIQATRVAPSLLKPASVSIQRVAKTSKTFYRARLIGLSEKDARRTCRVLESKKFQCLPIPPSQALAMMGNPATSVR